jgi:Ca2+-transporting ATPase
VNAVEEGRGIYDNIRKFVMYMMSSNTGEVLAVFVAMFIGFTVPGSTDILSPLLPIQLLWINLLTDGVPALAIGVEPIEPDTMRRPPRKSKEKIISKRSAFNIAFIGIIMAAGTLFVFNSYLVKGATYATTMAFTTIVIAQLFNTLNCKSRDKSIFQVGIMNNKWLILAILSSIGLQLLVLYTGLSFYMKTTALGLLDWLIIVLVGSTVLIFEEIRKFIANRSNGRA